MEHLEKIVSENLTLLRKQQGWTQADLAEKLHYSDKSISKWERGEALPDLKVMVAIADLYGVSVDFLLTEGAAEEALPRVSPRNQFAYQVLVSALTVCVIWFIATILYTYGAINERVYHWQYFIWAAPASFLVLQFIAKKWFHSKGRILYASLLIWTLLAAIYLEWLSLNMWMIFLIGVPAQIALVLLGQIKRVR